MMTIDSLPANLAATSANNAPLNPNPAIDGAQICTDAETGDVAAFAAIFEQLGQAIVTEEAALPAKSTNAPTLPSLPQLPEIPPPAIANEQPQADAVAAPLLNSNVNVIDEPEADVEAEQVDSKEKPQRKELNSDSVEIPAPVAMQPVELPELTPETEALAQPVIRESSGKRKPAQPQNLPLPKAEESVAKDPKKLEPTIEAVEISQQVTEEMPVAAKDDPSAPSRPKLDSPKIEFTLPQLHLVQREIDQPALTPPLPPEQAFIQANHPKIVSTIHGELLPNGGSMHIRMDPPELGALAVQIDVRDGIVTASFQTSNDEATRLLSHSLGQLRTTLESAGVSVEKLQVQQAPREHFNSNSQDHDRSPKQQAYERSAHDDQQRREMLQRLWRRLTVGRDMLDLVA